MKLRELARITGGRISGDPEVEITGVAGIKEAGEGDITVLSDRKYLEDALNSHASAVIVKEEPEGLKASMLVVDNPQLAFARALEVFYKKPFRPAGVSERAVVGSNVSMGEDVSVHPLACIGSNVTLGARVVIFPGVYIGEDVSIGDDSVVYANVTIRENVRLGSRVTVHAGAVIGADGFGYVCEKGIHHKIPQVGGVIIEDDVEIGANVVIDRATTGNTVVGCGTKIDNLVQIAHNVKIGKHCIIVAQTGISGSVEIGDGVVLAGQVGVRDHVKIGSRAMAGAQSGITGDIPAGEVYSGTPAIPHRTWLRAQSIYAKLPEYVRRLRDLEKKLNRV
ncbi:MAG: UDP-3-O-(3-hydroxymyristoyl)glucosamine N-acyltransferase [Deferribacteres bacterium]|nr:UDP-3-O-(3-hydroxymyristoyl)glucosamine N-acyltransferase [Deferribacteres bacterium]